MNLSPREVKDIISAINKLAAKNFEFHIEEVGIDSRKLFVESDEFIIEVTKKKTEEEIGNEFMSAFSKLIGSA